MSRKLSSTGVVLLALLYAFLAGQAAVCSHEGAALQQSEHDSGERDRLELFCGGDCQNISPVAMVSSPPASVHAFLFIALTALIVITCRETPLVFVASRAPPLATLS
ncbi:MAG: conserved exported protein of unknown function [Nitrospira sp.]|nr:MAG: conserved exported protein of unknown function [Nitrospira sp.]